MPWGHVHGHEKQVAALKDLAARGRLPHAFLFAGPEGIGKRLFAYTFAQALLCDGESQSHRSLDPCGVCPSCHMVEAGTHPDCLIAERPEEKHELPIETIRRLNHDLSLKPAMGRYRVAIVDEAHTMSEESANAFLKTLEEPPPGSVLILITNSPDQQLDTIVSRCRVLQFGPLEPGEVRSALEAAGIERGGELERLSVLAEGSVGRALALADPAFIEFRRKLLEAMSQTSGFDAPGLSRELEAHARSAGKESAQVRQRARLIVVELLRFFRAVLWRVQGVAPAGGGPGDNQNIEALAQRLTFDGTARIIQACLDADYQIVRKASLPLVFDCLLLKIEEQARG